MSAVSGWNPKRLTELADYINGYAFKPEDWGKEGLPIIRIEQLKNPGAQTDYFSGKLPPSRIINDGDLIFSWSASLFLRIWQHGTAALNQHLFKVVERDGVDRLFLKAFIDFYLPELTAASHGSTMQHITRKELDRFGALFPESKPEQTKIAEILSTVDRAIEQTEALIAKQQRLKTGLMQDLLTRGIDQHGNLRSEQTHEFKDSPLGRIPVEWEVKPISEIIVGIDAGWSPSCEDVTPGQGEWGVLKVSAISSGNFDPSESKRLPIELNPIESLEVRQDDVLISRANGVTELVGRCVFVHHTPGKLMLSDKTLRLRPRLQMIEPFMLSVLLAAEDARRQIMNFISGSSGQKNLSQKQIGSIEVALPSLYEQKQICSIISRASKQLGADNITAQKLGSLKTALMQDLLTGRKRVTELLNKPEVPA